MVPSSPIEPGVADVTGYDADVKVFRLVLSLVGCGAFSCASGPSPSRSEAPRSDYRVPAGPPAPASLGDLPSFAVPWTPPSIVAGNVDALRTSLSSYGTVALMLGPRVGGVVNEKEAYDLVTALSPQTKVVARGNQVLDSILRERGELPVRVQPVADGTRDVFGRPNYTWEGVALNTTWSDNAPALSGAEVMLVIDDANIDLAKWRKQPTSTIGSCEPILAAVGAARQAVQEQIAPMVVHTDRALSEAYREVVAGSIPALSRELAAYEPGRQRHEFDDGPSFTAYECGVAYRAVVDARAACETGLCSYAPRLVLHQGVQIGAPTDDVFVPSGCPASYGRDVRSDVDAMATAAAEDVAGQLDAHWLELAQRAAVLGQLDATLQAACEPRRRRFGNDGLDQARAIVTELEGELEKPLSPGTGRWVPHQGRMAIPGTGPVEMATRYEAGGNDASVLGADKLATLEKTLRQRETCRSGAVELPVVALLTDVATSEVRFMGYFYQEELVCEGLGPLTADPG